MILRHKTQFSASCHTWTQKNRQNDVFKPQIPCRLVVMVNEQVNKMSDSDTEDCCLLLDSYQQESPLVFVPWLFYGDFFYVLKAKTSEWASNQKKHMCIVVKVNCYFVIYFGGLVWECLAWLVPHIKNEEKIQVSSAQRAILTSNLGKREHSNT